MANPLSRMTGTKSRAGDSTAGEQLTRAAKWGMREALKGVVMEAIEESAAESRSSGGGTGRGLTMLGLGAIAGYLARDWQLRPEMYESVEEEISELPEQVGQVREEYVEEEDQSRSWTGRLGRVVALATLAGVGYVLVQRRRSGRGQEWTEERQEGQGGLAGSTAETGEQGQMGSDEMGGDEMGGEYGETMGDEEMDEESMATQSESGGSEMGGESDEDAEE